MVRPRRMWVLFILAGFLGHPLLTSSSELRPEGSLEELALRRLSAVQDVKLDIQDRRAIIQGKVRSYFDKRSAEQALLRLRGIHSVDNRLTVTPPARTDAQIKTDINMALQAQVWINPRKVVVRVVKNLVTISGVVEHLYEKDRIEELASAVRGLKDVVNNIRVVQAAEGPPRSGESIKQDVEAALLVELGEAARKMIAVEVNNGAVTLRGAVRNYYEKMGAYQAAGSVPGVLSVSNFLEIE